MNTSPRYAHYTMVICRQYRITLTGVDISLQSERRSERRTRKEREKRRDESATATIRNMLSENAKIEQLYK